MVIDDNKQVYLLHVIFGTRACTLFDTGVSYSFVGLVFALLHGFEFESLAYPREVQIPENTLLADGCCRSCPVQLEHWIMPAELLVLRQLRILMLSWGWTGSPAIMQLLIAERGL